MTESQADLEVVTWPVITPAELLRLRPTYTQLMAGYRTKTQLSVDNKSPNGKQLALLAPSLGLVLFSALQPGIQIDFYCGSPEDVDNLRFWWAIPSVIVDDSYPYRTHFLN
jgi:hypothetical protein